MRRESLPITPATSAPSATTQAPVKVARSTIASGASSTASAKPSARTNLPSASVLRTSMVLPLRVVRTSPGFVAVPLGMFSVHGAIPRTLTLTPAALQAPSTAITTAAPLMSSFIAIIPSPLLSDRPPESNVMPLPTTATVGTVAPCEPSGS